MTGNRHEPYRTKIVMKQQKIRIHNYLSYNIYVQITVALWLKVSILLKYKTIGIMGFHTRHVCIATFFSLCNAALYETLRRANPTIQGDLLIV
jgi:hypothetical protein